MTRELVVLERRIYAAVIDVPDDMTVDEAEDYWRELEDRGEAPEFRLEETRDRWVEEIDQPQRTKVE